MQIQFNIHYETRPGQRLRVSGSVEELGNWNVDKALLLDFQPGGYWTGTLHFEPGNKVLQYRYVLTEDSGKVLNEWGEVREVDLKTGAFPVRYHFDTWNWPPAEERVFYSAAFQKTIFGNRTEKTDGKESPSKKTLEFVIRVPYLAPDHQLCLLGNQDKLGNWNRQHPVLMSGGNKANEWIASLELTALKGTIYYKYGIYDIRSGEVTELESGDDRSFTIPEVKDDGLLIRKQDAVYRPANGSWRGAGVALPVFSLKTANSYGIGEFSDLLPFMDWAKSVGLKMVQILPVNETIACHNWLDSYPYKSISVMALHPAFLNPEKMGRLKDDTKKTEFEALRKTLNEKEFIDYPAVMDLKSAYYKCLFDQEKESFFQDEDYQRFFHTNKDWLIPYAAYAFLRDKYKTPDFRQWETFARYDEKKMADLSREGGPDWDDISIHYFIQYHLDRQLSEASTYARSLGIVLKGDIPIGISPNSVEAWTEPELFHLDGQAGAPPDDFAIKGQNWGFPTYHWEAMAKDGYGWWQRRLRKMGSYFDAYRIDHILGFFRIWEIPMDAVEGILGHFNPALPLSADEIRSYGIDFDYDRMVRPVISHHHLKDLFGERHENVIEKFLEHNGNGNYRLKDTFDTQRKVNEYFLRDREEEELDEADRSLRTGLFDLISNVLFLPLGNDQWHPRVSLHFTRSFQELDDGTKKKLDQLYSDFYYRRHNDFWYHKGMEKLPAIISASDMLVCGEDLGMVPDSVPPAMKELGILSLEIQRMPKDPRVAFAHPADAPYLSVCTTSTHDMPTIRGWWEIEREKVQRFHHDQLGHTGGAPYFAEPWVCRQIIVQHLYSKAMWTTFPIQDLLAIDGKLRWQDTHAEQINEPSNSRHKWRYRMHQSVEELAKAGAFNLELKKLILEAGR